VFVFIHRNLCNGFIDLHSLRNRIDQMSVKPKVWVIQTFIHEIVQINAFFGQSAFAVSTYGKFRVSYSTNGPLGYGVFQ